MEIEITEDQIKEIIYDARCNRNLPINELICEFIYPQFKGSIQKLKEKFPNHYILIEVKNGFGEQSSDSSHPQFFVKFLSLNGGILRVSLEKVGDGWHQEEDITFPNQISDMHVWVKCYTDPKDN